MSENSALRTLLHFVAEDLGVADKWKDRNPVQLTTDIRKSIATRDARIAELEAALCGIHALRMRIHFAEKHNQHFERCESAWCNPSPDEDPAKECIDALLAQAWREALEAAAAKAKSLGKLGLIGFVGLTEGELRQMAREVKLAKNKAQVWPKPTSEDEPVEHDRTHDDPLSPELGPEHREFWLRQMAREVKP